MIEHLNQELVLVHMRCRTIPVSGNYLEGSSFSFTLILTVLYFSFSVLLVYIVISAIVQQIHQSTVKKWLRTHNLFLNFDLLCFVFILYNMSGNDKVYDPKVVTYDIMLYLTEKYKFEQIKFYLHIIYLYYERFNNFNRKNNQSL